MMPSGVYVRTPEMRQRQRARMLANRDKMLGNKYALGYKHTSDALKRIASAGIGQKRSLGKKPSEKTRQKLREAMLGRTFSQESILKMRQSCAGRVPSEACYKARDTAAIGRPHSDQHKQNIRKGLQLATLSPESQRSKSRLLRGNKNGLGFKHTLEARQKIAIATNHTLESRAEVLFKEELAHRGIDFVEHYGTAGYCVDVLVPAFRLFVEVKGGNGFWHDDPRNPHINIRRRTLREEKILWANPGFILHYATCEETSGSIREAVSKAFEVGKTNSQNLVVMVS